MGENAYRRSRGMTHFDSGQFARFSTVLGLDNGGLATQRKRVGDNDDVEGLLDFPGYRTLVEKIVELDDTYSSGNITTEEYEQRHASLIYQCKNLLRKEDSPHSDQE